ncbi:MAG: Ig-like domain-containing protein, partial [Oscillospiraceae bacterium]|nr:Ig-like domain-containing protein [Oscillospiraceae bacterium]
AINVVVQMATKTGDDNYTDFYNDFDSDHTATDDGKDLLEIITDTKPVPATKVTINGGDRALNIGASYTPGCVVEPSNSTDGPVWTSSDNGVATVDPNTGKITGIGEGTAEITVTVGGQSDTVTITVSAVTKPLENLIITDGDPLTLNIGDEYPLHYTTDPADTTDKITWTSSDESVATVDPDTGVITAVDEGTAIITGTADSGVTADIAVNVSKSEIPAEFVQIGCGDQNLIVGDIYQVTPFSVLPSNTTDTMIWSSSDTSVARVDQKGEITAVGPGTAKITLTSGSLNDSINVTVKSPFIPIVDNGGQPYDNPLHNNDPSNQNNNFAMRVRIVYGTPMPDSSLDQDGSIPLSMIIPGTDYSDIGIKAADPSLSQYFYIGTDKADKPALMYKYIPENSVWEAADQASANSTPLVTMNLFLTKAGYADTPITVTLHYDSSQYIY